MMRRKILNAFILCFCFSLLILTLSGVFHYQVSAEIGKADASTSASDQWFYAGWQYRKEHNITRYQTGNSTFNNRTFYDLSDPWTTISGNPTQQHAFQPVHNTTIIEVNKVVDGSTQKYLAYDCDPDGSQIRLYYTNDTSGSWTAYSGNPILGPSSYHYRWPSVCYSNGTFHMFLGDRTDLTLERWTSTDGIHYKFEENVKTGGNEWKTPFIWFNPNDSRFYLYSHDAVGGTEYVKVRNATSIEGLHGAVDTIVVSRTAPFGAASAMYYNNTYWLLAEILRGSTWQVIAYSSSSPSSGFQECYNSPILSDDEACPILLLDSDQARAHLFVNRASSFWYQDTREVYINGDRSILSDYQIRITAHYGSGTDGGENVYLNGHARADFGDVRFAWLNSSSRSEVGCDYWIEKSNVGDNALFWVKIPEISNEVNSTIRIYYGKMDANTTANGYNTFDFFDDFSGDLSKWTIKHFDGNGSASIVDGWARVNAQPGGDFWGQIDEASGLFTAAPLNDSYAVETVFREQSYPANDAHNRFFMSRANLNDDSVFYTMLFDGDSSHITTNWRDTKGASAGWAGDHTGWARGSNTTFQARLAKSGTTYHASISTDGNNWYSVGSRNGNYHGYMGLVDSYHDGYTEFDWVRVRKCVNPEPAHGDWGTEDIGQCVIIDQTFVSAVRANVGSVQTVGFHAKWANNSSDVIGGSIYINGTEYATNTTGWLTLDATSSFVENRKWFVTGVNCSGVTIYTQTAQVPSVIWDQIKIVDGSVTKDSVLLGETTTLWFKALYAYDNEVFSGTRGTLYINGSGMLWSAPNNRWEYSYVATTLGSSIFFVSGVNDTEYNLTALDDTVGPETISVWSLPFSIISNSTISELVFNSTNKTLTFTVSGLTGTTGYTNLTISKTLIENISGLTIYLEGDPINYTTASTDYFWLIHFTYNHSTHKVVIILNSPYSAQFTETPLGTPAKFSVIALAIAILATTLLVWIRRTRRWHKN